MNDDWRNALVQRKERPEKWNGLHPYTPTGKIFRHTLESSCLFIEDLKHFDNHQNMYVEFGSLGFLALLHGFEQSLENHCEHCCVAFNKRIDEKLVSCDERITVRIREMMLDCKNKLVEYLKLWYEGHDMPKERVKLIQRLYLTMNAVNNHRNVPACLFYE